MSEGIKTNESEGVSATSSSTTVVAVGPGSNSAPSAPSSVAEAMQSPLGQSQIPTQFVFQQQIMSSPQQQQQQQQQIMNSPQQQLMASPQQQQQTANTPGPSPGGQQNQQNNNVAGASPMNTMNAMGMNNMSTINMSAMNSIMNNQGMAGMTMTSMNPGGFQQSMGHPGMTSNAMPQVQVIQQQLPYLPQLYSHAQGQQFIMPSNIALQPAGVNQTIQSAGFGQSIQVITAGKPFQPGQLTASHLQIAGKNMIQGNQNDNNAALFQFLNNANQQRYTTIPTSNNQQQTLLIGPLINTQAGNYTQQGQQQQQNQQQQQQQQQPYFQLVNGVPPKSPIMASANVGGVKNNMTGTGVSSSQASMVSQTQMVTSQANNNQMQLGGQMQPMQIISGPLQSMGQSFGQLPAGLTWANPGMGQPTLLTQNGPIYIRGTNPDGSMIFQAAPQQTITAQPAPAPQTPVPTPTGKPRADTPKAAGQRTLPPIMPSSSGANTPTPIRPASSVSTQTAVGASPATTMQAGTTRPAGKTKKVGRPPSQNQPRPVAPVVQASHPTLLQPVQTQQQLQQQHQNQQQQIHAVNQQILAHQFQMQQQHSFQIQQFPQQQQQQQQQQPNLMPLQAFQQVTQQSLDASQQAHLQQQMNEQQYQMTKPVLAVASSAATSCAPTSNAVTLTSASNAQQQTLASPASMPSPATTIQQQVASQPAVMTHSSSPYVTTTTTTTNTVRSNYKPIAPAPPQQQQQQPNNTPNMITMASHQLQQGITDKPDQQQQQQQQILTIGPAVFPLGMPGTHGIRNVGPVMGNFSTMHGDQQHGMVHLSSSGPATTCFITSPAMTSVSRMAAPLPNGMIAMPAPLSAMANMTQTVTQSAPTIHSLAINGPRMTIPPLQPVTVSVSSSAPGTPQITCPSPMKTPLNGTDPKIGEEMKESQQMPPILEEGKLTNGTTELHSPALRGDKKENGLPQAVVRPQILTHVLGDFVIQESSEPFPVGRFQSNDPLSRCNGHKNNNDGLKSDGEPPLKKLHTELPTTTVQSPGMTNDLHQMSTPKGATMSTCEGCGKMDFVSKFRRSKRFCSTACSKKVPNNHLDMNSPNGQMNGQTVVSTGLLTTVSSLGMSISVPSVTTTTTTTSAFNGDKDDSNLDAELLALAAQQLRPPSAAQCQPLAVQQQKTEPKPNIAKWSVTEVADFVRSLAGCADYADDFLVQEIDGQALMLLKADHLMSAMSMKLGPALKICAKIDAMRATPDGAPSGPAPAAPPSNGQTNGNH